VNDFKADYQGIGEMLKADFMQADMMERARRGKEFAEATAPYDEHGGSPHYKDLFRVAATPNTQRAEASLINDDEAAFQIEYGTRHTPKHRTLGKALDIMGA
jgi:hypothetical protein